MAQDIFDQLASQKPTGDIFDQLSSRQPADANLQQDASNLFASQHPYLKTLQDTYNQGIVNPVVQAANAVGPALRGIEKGIGAKPGGQDIQGPDMTNAPMAAKVLGDVAGGASAGLAATAAGAGNPILGYGSLSGLGAYGNNQPVVPAVVKGMVGAIPQMFAGKIGSSLASAAAKPIGGLVAKYAPNVGTAVGMGGASAGQAAMSGQNPVVAGASGAAFGLMSPMNPLGAKVQMTPQDLDAKIDNEGAPIYRNILNPGKGIIKKVEINSGGDINDSMKLAAKEALPINSVEGKLDNTAAIAQLKNSTIPLYDQQNQILASNPAKQFNLQDIGDQVKSGLTGTMKNAADLASAQGKIDNEIDAEILRHGENVDGQTLNMIKQGMWGKSYNPLEPNSNDASRAIGFAAKDAIEKAYPLDSIKENNAKIGQYLQLQKVLEATHGQVVQAGKIGKYVSGSIGGATGALVGQHLPFLGEIAGPVVGFKVGEKVNQMINDPARITANWAKKLSNIQVIGQPPVSTKRPGVVTPQVMPSSSVSSGSMNPVGGLAYAKPNLRPGRALAPNVGSSSGPVMAQSGYVPPGLMSPPEAILRQDRLLPSPRVAGQSSGPVIPGQAQPKLSYAGKPYEPGPQAIVTPRPGTPENEQTFPQGGSMNPLKTPSQGLSPDVSNHVKALALAGTLGIASVFNPSSSQATTVKDPDRLNLAANQYTMKNEGFRGMPYMDTTGHKTVGYGFNMDGGDAAKYIPDAVKQGRRALTQEEATGIFNKVYPIAVNRAHDFVGDSWVNLSGRQQKALIDMSYQMGNKLNGFHNLKAALLGGNFNTAAREVLNSEYARKDAPQRALQNSVLMQEF